MSDCKLIEEKVGGQWLITSPDVPGRYVSHADIDIARQSVPAAIDMLRQMTERRRSRNELQQIARRAS